MPVTVGKFGTGIFAISSLFFASLPTGPWLRRASFDDRLQVAMANGQNAMAKMQWQACLQGMAALGALLACCWGRVVESSSRVSCHTSRPAASGRTFRAQNAFCQNALSQAGCSRAECEEMLWTQHSQTGTVNPSESAG